MNVELDSREVLMHLQELGYYNITPAQLEDFMKDLRKLIKFDTIKKKLVPPNQLTADSTSSTLPNTTDESQLPSPPPLVSQRKQHVYHLSEKIQRNDFAEVASSSSESSAPPPRRILRECTKFAAQKSQEKENVLRDKRTEESKLPAKPSKSCDCMWRRIGCKCCDAYWSEEQNTIKTKLKENFAPPRPKSSFIRAWQVTGQPRPGSATHRSDPVSMYHHYQRLWKQQKLPGENNHNELRWSIRERMLGQEPHPRNRAVVVVPAIAARVS